MSTRSSMNAPHTLSLASLLPYPFTHSYAPGQNRPLASRSFCRVALHPTSTTSELAAPTGIGVACICVCVGVVGAHFKLTYIHTYSLENGFRMCACLHINKNSRLPNLRQFSTRKNKIMNARAQAQPISSSHAIAPYLWCVYV